MVLARRASSAPSIFTSSAPSGRAERSRSDARLAGAGIDRRGRATCGPRRAGRSRRRPAAGSRRCAFAARSRAAGAAPFAGRIVWRSADRRLAVGDAERPRPGETRSSAASGRPAALALKVERRSAMAGERQPAGVDAEREILDVEAVASVSQGRRARERDAPAGALAVKLASSRRVGGPPNSRPRAFIARPRAVPAEFEIARHRAAGRRQLDVGDRLPAELRRARAAQSRRRSSRPRGRRP